MKKVKENVGITLIALVITIIILIILAGIGISAITGDGGIIRKTQIAVNINELANLKEALDIYYVLNPNDDPVTTQVPKEEITDEVTQTKIVEYQPDVDFITDIKYERLYYLDSEKLNVNNLPEKRYILDIETGVVFVNNGLEVKEDGTKTYVLAEYERDKNKTNILAEGTKIYADNNNTYVVKENGDMYGVGEISSYNMLGLEWKEEYDIDLKPQKTDIQIVEESEAQEDDFIKVQSTSGGYIFQKKNGEVWAIGDNSSGQFGLGNTIYLTELTKLPIDNVKDVIVDTFDKKTICYLKEDGTLWACGRNKYYQYSTSWSLIRETEEEYITTPVQITYKIDGAEQINNIKQVYAAYTGIIILKNNGEIWMPSGINVHCRLENELISTNTVIKSPIRLTNIENLAKQNNSSIKQICSVNTTVVLLENGYLYTVGYGGYGLLCNGHNNIITKFEKVLENVDSFISNKAWEENIYIKLKNGQILGCGRDAGTINKDTTIYTPTAIPIENIVEVSNQIALTQDGKVYKLHYNENNEYNKQYTNVETRIKHLFNNGLIDEQGYIWAFGNVLLKDKGKRIYLTKSNISSVNDIFGNSKTIGIISIDREIYSLGNNQNRVLQASDIKIYRNKVLLDIPSNVTQVNDLNFNQYRVFIVDQNNELWYRGISNGAGGAEFGVGVTSNNVTEFTKNTLINNIQKVYVQDSSTIIQKTDGTLWATGVNNYGELGIGSNNMTYNFIQITKDNNANQIDFNNMKKLVCSNLSVACLLEDGTVYVWGRNAEGQLGLGDNNNVNLPTKISFFNGKSKVIDIIKMIYNTVFLLENGEVYVTGLNTYGQLGNGTIVDSNIPVKVNIEDVKKIKAGRSHIIAIKNDNSVWSWGSGIQGQLGNGKIVNELSPVPAYELAR